MAAANQEVDGLPADSLEEKISQAVVAALDVRLHQLSEQIAEVRASLTDFDLRIEHTKGRVSLVEDDVGALERKVAELEKTALATTEKLDDLENHSRRNNLRFVGFPESLAETELPHLLEAWLLGLVPSLASPSGGLLERAHRIGKRPDGAQNSRPRVIITRFLHFAHKTLVLQHYRKQREFFNETFKILVFQDFSPAVTLKRKAFHEYLRKTGNHSEVTEFLLLGFSEFPELQLPLFILFLLLYLMAVLGNLLVICIVCADPHLHTPMYFFLVNLSVLDISSLTVTVPKLLSILLTQSNLISFNECILQMFCFLSGPAVEFLLLTAMAYDRYVAICNPLHYTMIMSRRVCALLAAVSWIAGFFEALPHYILISQFSFCDSNVINHFFCDLTALLKLSCTDTSVITTIVFAEGVFLGSVQCLLTLTSYVFIIATILKIQSAEGKSKAFSTCSSHLTVLILSYGTILGVYMQPKSEDSIHSNKLPTAVYTVTLPLLNPLIYSLRSKDLKMALKKVISRKSTLSATKVLEAHLK
ncbi:olfactory receptor 3-like [Rhinatrema bivittatum]|uniref:olfactory receptor 3-like n=1 Tax=Rhinatrema bivittatum TaxID=194408 RepID=UPI00112C125A|nr:olfactory receptor 3-like [Rhinatrema bivittatum]